MKPRHDLHFAQDGLMVEELLLFSNDGTDRATEVTHADIKFGSAVTPLYTGSTLTEPVPVMVEGTYKVFNRATGRYEDFTITPDDIREYLRNTPRDVAMNYEHKRGTDPVGWLRLKETGECRTLQTKQGPRTALFASMELFHEAADKVKRGVYRDGSIELRPHAKEIIGHALTGHPIMRDTQFFAEPPVVIPSPEPVPADPTPPAPEAPANPTDTEVKEFSNMEPDKIIEDFLAKFGLSAQDIEAIPGLIASTAAEKRKAQHTNALTAVRAFSSDADGNSPLTGEMLDIAAQLYVFGEDHADVLFGEGDAAVPATALLEKLLRGVAAIQVFGETPGPSAAVIEGQEPVVPDADAAVDTDRVAALRKRIQKNMNIADA